MARIRMLVNGQVATGPNRAVKIHHSQMPEDISRQIGLRATELQKQHPDADEIDVEVGDLLLPPKHAGEALADALRTYIDTDKHRYNCAAENEGQWCCLDPDHPNFDRLTEVIRAVVRERTGLAL